MAKNESRVVTLDDEPQASSEAVPTSAAPVIEVVGANFDDQLCGDKVKIEIHEGADDLGKDDVFLQLNGYGYKIKRGKEVLIPVEILHIIENATMDVYESAPGGGHTKRVVKRFAYSVLGHFPKAS